jgi:hypothetical protein
MLANRKRSHSSSKRRCKATRINGLVIGYSRSASLLRRVGRVIYSPGIPFQMNPTYPTNRCTVCGEPDITGSSICPACEEAFTSGQIDPGTPEGIDVSRYTTKMFPWEPSQITPRLLSRAETWSFLCFGLVLIVILLSLLRAPLPTCWEISS